jgi:hypothetical protein
MVVAYIAHPIGGDVTANLKKIEQIGRDINLNEPEVVPFAPYFFDCHTLDDNQPEQRARGIKNNIALLKSGVVNELRVYGERISTGMWQEIDLALGLGIEIRLMTKETTNAYLSVVSPNALRNYKATC